MCPASLEGSLQMCTAAAASCRQIPGANTHLLLQPLSLFYFQGKKKEADGDRRQAPRAGRADTSAAAFQGKQLIPRTCPLLDMQITRQGAGQSLPWVKALRGLHQPFFIQSGNHPWAFLVNFSNSGHCYTAFQFLQA